MSVASPEDQLASLESLRACAKQLSKDRSLAAFYPHVYWWDLERYLKLVCQGARFEVRGKRLCWDLPEQVDDG